MKTVRSSCLILGCVTPLALLAPYARSQSSYSLTDLGSLPAYNRYFGNGINLSGQAAVSNALNSTPGHALLYDGTRLIDLGVFKNAGANQSGARAINNLGWVVGTATNGRNVVAALWRNGQIVQIAPNFAADMFGINNGSSPQITGSYHPKNGQTCAFLWQNGALTNLPFGEGHAINDLGQVAGRNNDNGCFWSQSSGLINLPVLSGVTSADAINAAGVCAGYSHDLSGNYHAVYWDANHMIHDMGLFSGAETKAYAINSAGTVVGQFYAVPNVTPGGAFRWDATVGYVDLNALMPAGSGWFLTSANGINDNGQILCTASLNGGPERAVILTPQ